MVKGEGDGVVEAAWRFFANLRTASEYEAARCLTAHVSQIVERYRAASAWLFTYCPLTTTAAGLKHERDAFPLKCVLAHNADKVADLSLYGTLAGKAVRKRRAVIYPRVLQAHGQTNYAEFYPVKANTQCAAAVPIFAKRDFRLAQDFDRPIGALVLESHRPYSFSVADINEAAVEADLLAADLLFLRELSTNALRHVLWHPALRGWNITRVLSELCYALTAHVAGVGPRVSLGMTIWQADEATWTSSRSEVHHEYFAYAIGAERFDNDYLEQRTIPTYKSISQPLSYVGQLICDGDPFHCADSPISDAFMFRRVEKSERMEVEHIFGTTVPKFITARSVDATPPHPNAIVFYGYRGIGSKLHAELQADKRQRLAQVVSQFLVASAEIVSKMAAARLWGQLRANAVTGVNTFNIVRDVLMDVFDADGVSIFVTEPASPDAGWQLKCVTTSGILRDGDEVGVNAAAYPLGTCDHDKLKESAHATVRLGLTPSSVKRINERRDEASGPASQRFLEAFTLLEHEHRRMLLASLQVHEPTQYSRGIVRIVRSGRKRHFTPNDADVMRELMPFIEQAVDMRNTFEGYRNRAKDDSLMQSATDEVHARMIRAIPESADEAKSDLVRSGRDWFFRTFLRLRNDIPCYSDWGRQRVDAIIQDMFFAFRDRRPCLALLNMVERNRADEYALRIHAFHSSVALQGPEEGSGEPLRECEGSIGWDALTSGRIIKYSDEHPRFTTVFARLGNGARNGLVLPIMLPFRAGPMRATVHIEWLPDGRGAELPIGIHELTILAAAGWRIARCALDKKMMATFEAWLKVHQDVRGEFTPPWTPAKLLRVVQAGWQEFVDHFKKHARTAGVYRENQLEVKWEGLQVSRLAGVPTLDCQFAAESAGNVQIYKNMREDGYRYSPMRLLWRFTRRDGIDFREHPPQQDHPRILGRLNPVDEELLANLEHLGVRLCAESGSFVFPLWTVSGVCGWYVGQFANSDHPMCLGHSPDVLRIALREMRLFVLGFTHWQASIAQHFGDWGIELSPVNGGREWGQQWLVHCDPLSAGIRIGATSDS